VTLPAQATTTLTQGVPATIMLSGPSQFKGFLALKPSSAVGVLSAPSVGIAYGSCGFGHVEASAKSSVTFTFTPATTVSSVTLTGFVVQSFSAWYSVSTTLQVQSSLRPPPPPPSPPVSLASLQAQLAAARAALLPPACAAGELLQYAPTPAAPAGAWPANRR
jgi:hypothetical protein